VTPPEVDHGLYDVRVSKTNCAVAYQLAYWRYCGRRGCAVRTAGADRTYVGRAGLACGDISHCSESFTHDDGAMCFLLWKVL